MNNIVFLQKGSVNEILAQLAEEQPDMLLVVSFKDGEYTAGYSKVDSITRTIGFLEILKHKLLED